MLMKRFHFTHTVIFLLCFIGLQGSVEAQSFPFRNVRIGDSLPQFTLTETKGAKTADLTQFKGKPLVLIFWGADLETKKERSIKALSEIQQHLAILEKKGVQILSVNVQGDDATILAEVTKESSATYPTLLDLEKEAYGSLGIFVMPSILLIDKDWKISAGMGYSHDLIERLQGEVSIMTGEKTREEVEADLHPQMTEKSKEEKAAHRHLNMGNVMLQQGMLERAIEEFQKALQLDPQSAAAHIELACTYIDSGKLDEADKELEAGLKLDPESVRGQLCDARLTAASGQVDEAIEDLKSLLMLNARDSNIHYTLGSFYEKKQNMTEAAHSYRKAFELLEKKENH